MTAGAPKAVLRIGRMTASVLEYLDLTCKLMRWTHVPRENGKGRHYATLRYSTAVCARPPSASDLPERTPLVFELYLRGPATPDLRPILYFTHPLTPTPGRPTLPATPADPVPNAPPTLLRPSQVYRPQNREADFSTQ